MTTKIAISTPTGNIGSKVTEHLLRQAREQQLEIVLLTRKPLIMAIALNGCREPIDGRDEFVN